MGAYSIWGYGGHPRVMPRSGILHWQIGTRGRKKEGYTPKLKWIMNVITSGTYREIRVWQGKCCRSGSTASCFKKPILSLILTRYVWVQEGRQGISLVGLFAYILSKLMLCFTHLNLTCYQNSCYVSLT